MSDKKWTRKTAATIAECITHRTGIEVSSTLVRRLLDSMNYSLKSNKKCLSSGSSPHRDTQFGIINGLREDFMKSGDPIISVDSKKKELIGLYKNPGKVWCQEPTEVNDHDFRSQAEGLAAPYGIYDLQMNTGMFIVGQSADTPEFAVTSICTWWEKYGSIHYPESKRLLILADSGGSNGARPRAWKKFLQDKLADTYGLTIVVAHYPTGTSKWNPIEHRMFSEISKNWAGIPLETFEMVVELARNTQTAPGLRVEAELDHRIYEKGIRISDREMKELAITRGEILGNWNYTISPINEIASTLSESAT